MSEVVFRADASERIGAGHLMRCLSLADALATRGARCSFISRPLPESLERIVRGRGHDLRLLDSAADTQADDASATGRMAPVRADWLIVDHYGLSRDFESRLRGRFGRIMAIDDLADRAHDCDLLLDQNPYADADSRYGGLVPAACRQLLGVRHALLREEFRQARERARVRDGRVRRILVSFGGTDPTRCTRAALEAISEVVPEVHLDCVIGADQPERVAIEALCGRPGWSLHVQASNMAELMLAADLAVGAAGSSSWERCCVGLPALCAVVADNQLQLARDADDAGLLRAPRFTDFSTASFATHLRAMTRDEAALRAMSRRGLEAVDGLGTARVTRALGLTGIEIRRATAGDSRSLFDWRNDPSIRAVSRNTGLIEWPDHARWLSAVLADPNRPLLIGSRGPAAIGVTRFDIAGDSAEVSIYKVPQVSQPGAGADLLAAAEEWLRAARPDVGRLVAVVLGDNRASHALFKGAGYRFESGQYSKRIDS